MVSPFAHAPPHSFSLPALVQAFANSAAGKLGRFFRRRSTLVRREETKLSPLKAEHLAAAVVAAVDAQSGQKELRESLQKLRPELHAKAAERAEAEFERARAARLARLPHYRKPTENWRIAVALNKEREAR